MDVAGQFAGRGIAFSAQVAYTANVGFRGRRGNAFRKYADPVVILGRITGSAVAADDVIIQHSLKLPALFFGHFGKVSASVQPLFLTRDGEEDDGGGEFMFAEYARAFQ